MKYPCGIIKDLLPLYIDDVCTPESKETVETHLAECKNCNSFYVAMKSPNIFVPVEQNHEEEKMVNSLKQVKHRISKKIKTIVVCAVAAVAIITGGMHLLFNAPIKDVSLEDVSISANVYSLAELIENPPTNVPDSESVSIFSDEDDTSKQIEVKIPELGRLTLTEDVIEKCKCVSTIFVESEYFLREVKKDVKDHTIYISAFRTSILNNKAGIFNTQMIDLEFQEINKIVYVEKNGTETLLWSK